jgi:hypothetical protein
VLAQSNHELTRKFFNLLELAHFSSKKIYLARAGSF